MRQVASLLRHESESATRIVSVPGLVLNRGIKNSLVSYVGVSVYRAVYNYFFFHGSV